LSGSNSTPRFVIVDGKKVRVLTVGPAAINATASPEKKPTVVLFHGNSFSIDDWVRIGTPTFLSENGYETIAIDLPSGKTSQSERIRDSNFPQAIELVNGVLQELQKNSVENRKLVIVGPSMGGRYALSFGLNYPERVMGLVLVAPSLKEIPAESLETLDIPVLLIWGERDRVFPVEEYARNLKNTLPRAKLLIIKGAGHAAYLDKRDEFHDLLVDFIDEISE
jgi:abhydrolase domain-containing protein 14